MTVDDDGVRWPTYSLLIASVPRGAARVATDEEMSGLPGWWLGKDYVGHRTDFDTPPRDLAKWKYIGDVKKIFYDRFGDKAPGVFRHFFNKARGLWRVVAPCASR